MNRALGPLLVMCTLLAGCAIGREPEARFPIKIGLLADSQITSQNGFSDYHYRSKTADSMIDVAIRPPALECVLAEEMLEIALARLEEDAVGDHAGVDVILYLGDGANSGGEDEIDAVLRILDEHRQRTNTPIFIIIGNHDYLGAGNTVSPGTRFALLNRYGRPENRALTKHEVLRRFSAFNRENERLPAGGRFRYVDNIAVVEQHPDLDHDTGLYLSGAVTYAAEGKDGVQILLLDSSDYKDAPDWSEVADLGFYGVIGSVSFKDEPGFVSQTSALRQYSETSAPAFRFLASHYPKDHLDRVTFAKPGEVPLNVTNLAWDLTEGAVSIPTFAETLNRNLEPLLLEEKRNYWVSGHTHVSTMPRPERFAVGGLLGERYFRALNVGSTTDYRPHVAIVERFAPRGNERLDDHIGYREIPLCGCDDALLAALPRAIAAWGREHVDDQAFRSLVEPMDEWIEAARAGAWLNAASSLIGRGSRALTWEERYWVDTGATILGLNKRYREEAWGDDQTEAAARQLTAFVDRFVDAPDRSRDEVIAALGLLAGAYENAILPGKCDFSAASLRRLFTDPT